MKIFLLFVILSGCSNVVRQDNIDEQACNFSRLRSLDDDFPSLAHGQARKQTIADIEEVLYLEDDQEILPIKEEFLDPCDVYDQTSPLCLHIVKTKAIDDNILRGI